MNDPARHLALAQRETATSYVSRLAAAKWVNAATLAIDKETTFQRVIDGAPETFAEMADFGVAVPPDVLAWSAIKRDGHQREFRSHFFRARFYRRPRCEAVLSV